MLHVLSLEQASCSHPIQDVTRPPVYKSIEWNKQVLLESIKSKSIKWNKQVPLSCHCSQSPTLESNTLGQGRLASVINTFTTVTYPDEYTKLDKQTMGCTALQQRALMSWGKT